jgi:hypothetical protein
MNMSSWFYINFDGVNLPGPQFTLASTGQTLNATNPYFSLYPTLWLVDGVRPPYSVDVVVSAKNFRSDTVKQGDSGSGYNIYNAITVNLWHSWPYLLRSSDFVQPGAAPFGAPLDDGDDISLRVEKNVLPSNVVEIWLRSDLQGQKRINVPDGEKSSWNIWTAAGRKVDFVGLWSWQTTGQYLTFEKAKVAGFLSSTYGFPVSGSWLPPGSRATFTWLSDARKGTAP